MDAGAGATRAVTFTLTNPGGNPGIVRTVLTSGSGAFSVTGSTCTGISLWFYRSCRVTVEYAPNANGETDRATLTVATTRTKMSLTLVGMTGTPHLTWSPSPYDFGTVNAGSAPTQTFTLTNSGTGTSSTLAASLTGSSAFSIPGGADTCSGTKLGPEQTCQITVRYAPTGNETDSTTLAAGGASAGIAGTGDATAPGSFTVSASTTGIDAGAALSWDAADPNGGGTVTYTVTCNDVTASTSTSCGSATTSTSETVSGLNPGDTYTFTVAATNANPLSTDATSNSVVAATAPGTFTVSASTTGVDSGAALSWDAASPNGGGTVTYTVTCNDVNASTSTPCGSATTSTSETVGGLNPGDTYTFTVTATNTDDLSTDATSNSVLAATVPGTFTVAASYVGGSDSYASISWTTVASVGFGPYGLSPITYTITCNDQTTSTSSTCGSQKNGNSSSLSEYVSGLNAGDTYTFTVAATNANDLSTDATSNTVTTTATGPIAPIPHIVVDPGQDAQETVVVPPNAGGCPPQDPSSGGCALQNTQDGSIVDVFDASGSIDPNSTDNQALAYQWTIRFPPTLQSTTYSSNGIAGYDSPVLQIDPSSLPALEGTDAGSDTYWRAQLTITDTNTGVQSTVYFRFKYQQTQLTLAMSTDCQLGGYPTYGCTAVALDGLPTSYAPGGFAVAASTAVSGPAADISWTAASAGQGGGPVTYTIMCDDKSASVWTSCGTATTSSSETVTGLSPGDDYLFAVIATNALGGITLETSNTVTIAG